MPFLLRIGLEVASAQLPASPSPHSAQDELAIGTDLTRSGQLQAAIPHLLAARRNGADGYADSLNLAICYLGTGRYPDAADTLESLRASLAASDARIASVNNLLSQTYLGEGRRSEAWQVFEEAAAQAPKDEKLYDYLADASTDHHDYQFGLRIVDAGLQQLPDSPRLRYERGLFLARLDRISEAKPEFERAAALANGSYVAYLARVQEDLYDEEYADALRRLREAIKGGQGDSRMLSLLGTVLLHQGAAPGDADFSEAQNALEQSVRLSPNDGETQLALGKVYLLQHRPQDASKYLETARELDPDNPAVYINLAQAYRQLGRRDKMRDCQAELSRLIGSKTHASASQLR